MHFLFIGIILAPSPIQYPLRKLIITIQLICILYAQGSGQNLHDLDAKEYIYKANITIPEEKIAISKLFRALKYYGIWDDIHALYLPCGGTELSHSLNAKDPRMAVDAYPLVFPNGATHKNSGISWNGIDQGARSSYRPTTDRLHLMVYHKEPANQPVIFSGGINGITDYLSYTWSALFTYGVVGFANTNNFDFQTENERTGFFLGQRINHDYTEAYVNGVKKASWQNELSSFYNTDTSQYIWLNKSNQQAQFLDTTEYQMVSIGSVLKDEKVELFYKITQAFLSELNLNQGQAGNWPVVPNEFVTKESGNYNWIKASSQAVDTAIDGVHVYSINDSLYLWGGWNGNWAPYSFNTGHVSGDGGFTWKPIGIAPWNVRHSASYGSDQYNNSYLIGSDMMPYATPTDRKEVWKSINGRDWEMRTNNAPWSGDLVLQGLAIKGDTLYVGGGQIGTSNNNNGNDTIWRSIDKGATWNIINTNADHLGGNLYNNFKYFKARKKFVAFCGGKYDNDPDKRISADQVWVSDDCITWERESNVPFEARQYSDMVEFDNKLWVIAGGRPASTGNGSLNLKDVWYMDEMGVWHEKGSIPFPERHATGLTMDSKNNRLVIACGNMHQDVWLLEKINKGPKFNAPLIKDVYSNTCQYIIPNLQTFVTGAEHGTQFSQYPAAGTIVPVTHNDLIEVKITGTSQNISRTQSVTIRILDTVAPLYTHNDTVIRYLSNTCKIAVPNMLQYLAAQDNCAGNILTQPIPTGTILSAQHNQEFPIDISASDAIGNSRIYTIILKVKDTIKPNIVCPASKNIQLGTGCKMVIPDLTAGVIATDNCSAVTISQNPAAGTNIPTLPNTSNYVILSAIDAAGNIKTCTVQLTGIDTTSPGFGPVTNKQFFTDAGKCYSSVVVSMPPVIDDCNVTVTKQRSDGLPAGSVFKVGETTIMWVAEDLAGNEAVVEQKIIVIDNQSPAIEVLEDRTYCAKQNNMYILPSLVSTDNCGVATISYTVSGATTRSGNSNNASGNFNPGVNYINWKVTDLNGNVTTSQTKITINQPLTLAVENAYASVNGAQPNTIYLGYGATSLTLNAQAEGGLAPYQYSWSNGSKNSSLTVSPTYGGKHIYTVKVTDALGCVATVQVIVKVIDIRCEDNKILVCRNEPITQTTSCVTRPEAENLLNQGYLLGPCGNPVMQDSLMYFSVRVKPNPSPTHFTLNIHHIYDAPLIIRVFDMNGRLMETMQLYTQQIELMLGSNYQAGVYIAEVSCGRYKKQLKLVKTAN